MDQSIIEHWLQQRDDDLLYDPDGELRRVTQDLAIITHASIAHATTALEALLHSFGQASQSAQWFSRQWQKAHEDGPDEPSA